ncbi:MAG TPA: GNAT family N-acetyltransferase [Gaiellaceae bacterium]|nr:GNAT family N-acetyltransferase [Gaiellaceae bacterium]
MRHDQNGMTLIRRGGHQDVAFMRSLLTHAYNWHVNRLDTAEFPLGRYVDGWGRPGDTALVAMEGGHRVGAGWFRLFRESAPGYGFVDERTPELTIVVVPSRQGQGIGEELLARLVERARADGHPGLSVSVEKDGADARVFEAHGFEPAAETDHGVILRRVLRAE